MGKALELGIIKAAVNMDFGKLLLIVILFDHSNLISTSIKNSAMMPMEIICGQRSREKILNMEDLNSKLSIY